MLARCPECEDDIVLPDPPEGPEVRCTTCGVDWAPGPVDPDRAWRVPPGAPALWARVLRRYPSEQVHRAFIEFCGRAGALDYAARRYRQALDRSGGTDGQAAASLLQIEALAAATLTPARRTGRRPVLLLAAVALLLALGVGAATALLVGRLAEWAP